MTHTRSLASGVGLQIVRADLPDAHRPEQRNLARSLGRTLDRRGWASSTCCSRPRRATPSLRRVRVSSAGGGGRCVCHRVVLQGRPPGVPPPVAHRRAAAPRAGARSSRGRGLRRARRRMICGEGRPGAPSRLLQTTTTATAPRGLHARSGSRRGGGAAAGASEPAARGRAPRREL